MSMRCRWWLIPPVLLAAVFTPLAGQPPAAPSFPPIAPGSARLDQTVNGLDGPGFAVVYDEGTGTLAAACEQGTVPYWHKDVMMGLRVGEGTPTRLAGHQGPVTALAWSGGPVLASAGADQRILLWEMPGGAVRQTLTANGTVRALAMSPDGKWLASAGDDPVVQLWDTVTGKPGPKLAGHTDWVLALAFNRDGSLLASGGYDNAVRVWKLPEGKKLLEVSPQPPPVPNNPPPPANAVQALAFSPDGKLLAVGGSEPQILLVNTADGKLAKAVAGHNGGITSLAFHPGGTVLASASKDGTVRLWSPDGQPLKVLEGHTAWVQGITFLARGTRLASVGADQTVRLWDLTQPK